MLLTEHIVYKLDVDIYIFLRTKEALANFKFSLKIEIS